MRECQGKVFITTNASNVSRLNQAIAAAEKLNRKVCFVGRSIIKAKQLAQKLGYLHIKTPSLQKISQPTSGPPCRD
jgi:ribonuclease J